MLKKCMLAMLFALAFAWPAASRAAAVFVPAAAATDMVYDFRRNLLYIANGNQVLRYAIGSSRFIAPITLAGSAQARGMDISRDGSQLAVADLSTGTTQGWVQVVDLATLAVSQKRFDLDFSEGGTWSVAYAADGSLLEAGVYLGSGWVPLRRLAPGANTWSTVASVRNGTMLSASTDRNTIAFAEADISDGEWGLYDVPTGQVVRRQGYDDGTSAFNFDIATDALGAQFAIPTYPGLYVYDDAYRKVATVPAVDHHPVGVAFHPVRSLVYYPWSGTRQVRVFSTPLNRLVAWYDLGEVFDWSGNSGFQPGRTKLSADGSLLMVLGKGGVRMLRLYAPLAAANRAVAVTSGVATNILLKGSIGNNDPLAYGIQGLPKHGRLTISGAVARYQSTAGYKGTDSFRYIVRYGAAAYAVATVTVTVR